MSGLSLIGEYSSDSEDEKLSSKKEENHQYNTEKRLVTFIGYVYQVNVTIFFFVFLYIL